MYRSAATSGVPGEHGPQAGRVLGAGARRGHSAAALRGTPAGRAGRAARPRRRDRRQPRRPDTRA